MEKREFHIDDEEMNELVDRDMEFRLEDHLDNYFIEGYFKEEKQNDKRNKGKQFSKSNGLMEKGG